MHVDAPTGGILWRRAAPARPRPRGRGKHSGRQRRVDTGATDPQIELATGGKNGVTHLFGSQAPTIKPPEQVVQGIGLELVLIDRTSHAVTVRVHDQSMHRFEAAIAAEDLRRQPIQ